MARKCCIIFCLVLWFVCPVRAGRPVLKSWQMTTAHGLPNNTVRCVFQDHRGRIWMGTQNGLACYDGNRVEVYALKDAGGEERIPCPKIRQIVEDGGHRLWLVLGDGRHAFPANHVAAGASGEVWLWHGEHSVLWLAGASGSVSRMPLEDGETVRRVCEGRDGSVYVGTSRRLLVRPAGRKGFLCAGRGHDYVEAVVAGPSGGVCWVSRDGRLWLARGADVRASLLAVLPGGEKVTGAAAWRGRVVVFTRADTWSYGLADGKLERLAELQVPGGTVFSDNRGGIWACNGTGVLYGLPEASGCPWIFRLLDARQLSSVDRERYAVCRLRDGRICISAYGAGLFVYDVPSGELSRYSAADRMPLIGSDFLYEVIEDRSGDIWVGQRNAGVAHLFVVSGDVRRVNALWAEGRPDEAEIRAVACAPAGKVWLADRAGRLLVLDSCFRHAGSPKACLPSPGYSIGFDAGGNVWVGTRKHGLWDMRSGKALGGGGVFCVCTDRSGRVWAGCFGDGLRVCDDRELRDPFGGAGPARRIRWMSVGPAGRVWAATEAGLLTFDPDSLWSAPTAYELYTSRNSGLCGSELNTVFADFRGFVWVGTLGHGVFRCRRLSGGGLEVERYDVGRGLAANEVQAVVEDRDGGIWVATQYGLSRMESGADAFSSFFLSSTLQGDMYSANAAVRAKDGSLLFGTSDGLAVIGPSGMDAERFSPLPCFTEFYAGGRPLVLEEDSSGGFRRMELGWGQNSVTVRFSNLDYSRFRSSRYSYKLEGYDTCWSVPSEAGEAVYRHLPPGDYTLLVRSSNSSGVWCAGTARLELSVSPPFYQTPWAYAGYVCLAVLVTGTAWRVTVRMMRLRRLVEMERGMSGFKLRFFRSVIQGVCEPLDRLRESLPEGSAGGRTRAELGRIRELLQQTLTFKDRMPDEEEARILLDTSLMGEEDGGKRPEEAEADAFKARMESIVAEHLGDAAFTAEAWAEQMGLRRTAFYRRTKDVTGMTPNEFLRTARLKRAAELLLEGCLSVSEVAYRVGFDDLSYFSKSFKAYFGMSPSVFQKEKR